LLDIADISTETLFIASDYKRHLRNSKLPSDKMNQNFQNVSSW